MKNKHSGITVVYFVSTLVLAACGGGGGGGSSGPVASTLSFPLRSGYNTITANGFAKGFSVSGTCNGTGNRTTSPANTSTTFESQSALSSTSTLTITLNNCTPSSIAQSSTDYYDSNYVPRGYDTGASDNNANYGVYLTPPSIPTSVTVGGTGIMGTETLYTSNSKGTQYGTEAASYVVEADTSTTAIFNYITKVYNTGNTLLLTEQDRWRVTASGVLTPISADIQYANGSTTHLVLTYN
jgi:hypothetical protein